MGKIQKKGKKGVAAQYLTRNRAIKKLQITLKDFRRLCILKGIYPRDPKKKKYGKDKTYYHQNDIKFLSHEPLLDKYRALKTFLKRKKKAQVKKDTTRMTLLEKNKPKFTYDHLVKERYPRFTDALRDMDDPLCMIYLFAGLPSHITRDHSPKMAALCEKLAREWLCFVFKSKTLRKAFVSIKGTYYQANIQGQDITWLVPHAFKQAIPVDVDFKVMLTFLDFYLTCVKFVNFKLFHSMGLAYPPIMDAIAEKTKAGLNSVRVDSLVSGNTQSNSKVISSSITGGAGSNKSLQSSISAVLKEIQKKGAEGDDDDEEDKLLNEEKEAEKLDDFGIDVSEMTEEQKTSLKCEQLFKGLTFLLSREVPVDNVEFVILCGGGSVLRESNLTEAEVRNEKITHHVVDRPNLSRCILSREYIQPQWVFDSFNVMTKLPVTPYAPGIPPPAHLSPFVDDEVEGYVPKQRQVLIEWIKKANHGDLPLEGDMPVAAVDEAEDEDNSDNDEENYQKELQAERAGVKFSAKENDDDEDDDDEVEGSEGEGDDDDAVDAGSDSDEAEGDEESEEEEEEVKPSKKRGRSNSEEDLPKIMMGKKDARVYSRMQYGIAKKQAANSVLQEKRQKIEKQADKKQAPAKKATPVKAAANKATSHKASAKKSKK